MDVLQRTSSQVLKPRHWLPEISFFVTQTEGTHCPLDSMHLPSSLQSFVSSKDGGGGGRGGEERGGGGHKKEEKVEKEERKEERKSLTNCEMDGDQNNSVLGAPG